MTNLPASARVLIAGGGIAALETMLALPVLRGLLLTGATPAYLRREIFNGCGETVAVDGEPLWWPPAKIVARYLGPFLAERAGAPGLDEVEDPEGLLVSWEADARLGRWHRGAGPGGPARSPADYVRLSR